MRQMPLLLLLLASLGLVVEAPFGEQHRLSLMLGILGLVGLLALLRGLGMPLLGLLGDEDGGRRPWLAALGVAVLMASVTSATWAARAEARLSSAPLTQDASVSTQR